jgi:hypothetical protein
MPTHITPYIPDGLPAALALLLGPALPAASACRGRAPLHDDTVHGESADEREQRHAQACAVCAGCPARTECAAVAEHGVAGDPGAAVSGVLAGHLVPEPDSLAFRDQRRQLRTTGVTS